MPLIFYNHTHSIDGIFFGAEKYDEKYRIEYMRSIYRLDISRQTLSPYMRHNSKKGAEMGGTCSIQSAD